MQNHHHLSSCLRKKRNPLKTEDSAAIAVLFCCHCAAYGLSICALYQFDGSFGICAAVIYGHKAVNEQTITQVHIRIFFGENPQHTIFLTEHQIIHRGIHDGAGHLFHAICLQVCGNNLSSPVILQGNREIQ